MYIPKQYQMDHDEAVQLMKSNPFALLISVDEHRPVATHLPLEIREQDGKIYATGHIANGNMQKDAFNTQREVLLVFQGPHAYISSSWYTVDTVPTWDYLSIHAYGKVRIVTEDELKTALTTMLARYESQRENGRTWQTFDANKLENEMKGIIGFEIEITTIQAAAKMSQNRSDIDYQSIVAELGNSNDQREVHVAKWMREQRKGLFS